MSTKGGRFGGLSARLAEQASPAPATPVELKAGDVESADNQPTPAGRTKGRQGKRVVAGYFSNDLSRGLRTLAAEEGTSVQALMGEAFDLLMRNRGKHPFNER